MNPMLRAAHLAAGDATRTVLLVVPWVEPEQQALIYPPGLTFETREQQAEYILKGEKGGREGGGVCDAASEASAAAGMVWKRRQGRLAGREEGVISQAVK